MEIMATFVFSIESLLRPGGEKEGILAAVFSGLMSVTLIVFFLERFSQSDLLTGKN